MTAIRGACVYRFHNDLVDFTTVGQLEKHEGVYVLVATCRWEDILQMQLHTSRARPLTIDTVVGDEVVMVTRAEKVRARPREGSHADLWAIIGPAA